MKKILAISNSFGVDANRYLYGIARAAGEKLKIVTLYIGGCSLYRHYRNMLSGERAYEMYFNGVATGFHVSLDEALLSDEWDVVTLQQSSPQSGDYGSYEPFLSELLAYVKKYAPKAKQYIHKTWAYSGDEAYAKKRLSAGFDSREEMLEAVDATYTKAINKIKVDGVIPSFEVMKDLYSEIGEKTYRDGFHASLGVGRYALGCVWFEVLFGKEVIGNTYRDFDVEVSEEEVALAQRIAHDSATSI